jgi:hypothetical protein
LRSGGNQAQAEPCSSVTTDFKSVTDNNPPQICAQMNFKKRKCEKSGIGGIEVRNEGDPRRRNRLLFTCRTSQVKQNIINMTAMTIGLCGNMLRVWRWWVV